MVHTCVFKKIIKICYIFGKNARNKCFDSFQHISAKNLSLPYPYISLMTKDLAQIKAYTHFNVGDAKTAKIEKGK